MVVSPAFRIGYAAVFVLSSRLLSNVDSDPYLSASSVTLRTGHGFHRSYTDEITNRVRFTRSIGSRSRRAKTHLAYWRLVFAERCKRVSLVLIDGFTEDLVVMSGEHLTSSGYRTEEAGANETEQTIDLGP